MLTYLQRKIAHQRRYLRNRRRISLTMQFLLGALEYYDFFAFAFVFYYLSQIFQPATTAIYEMALISLVSFIFRPVGYRLYLKLRPKYSRKTIIIGNAILMTFAIVSTGLIPTDVHHLWQVFLWLIIGRIIHGISFGFKLQSNLRFIRESFPTKVHSNIASSILGAQLGLTCAALVYKLVFTNLSPMQLEWGWRLPFFIGGIFSIILAIFRLTIYRSSNNVRVNCWNKQKPLDTVALEKYGHRLWLGLMIVSSRACLMFTLFIIIPGFLRWILKWNLAKTTDIMLAASLLSTNIIWFFRRQSNSFHCPQRWLLPALILVIPLTIILGISLKYHDERGLVISILCLAAMNGYLFVAIPQYIENIFSAQHRLEAMLFIGNLEFFNFNLIRRVGIFIFIVFFGTVLEEQHYVLTLCCSIIFTVLLSILSIVVENHYQRKKLLILSRLNSMPAPHQMNTHG